MTKEIYFAGGCFWGTEHFFKQIRGVVATEVGYANGNTESPTYQEVYTDTTGYAETVKIVYNPCEVSLRLLTEMFFKSIDPTSLNKQGEEYHQDYLNKNPGGYCHIPFSLMVMAREVNKK